jgi:hypothetical protein
VTGHRPEFPRKKSDWLDSSNQLVVSIRRPKRLDTR